MKESGKIKKFRQLEINSNMITVDMILKSTPDIILLIYSKEFLSVRSMASLWSGMSPQTWRE